jgi:hypothetical protein
VLRDNCARTSTIFRCYRIRRFEAAPALWTPINQLELGSAPWMGQQQLLAGWLRRISYETTVMGDVPLSRMSPPLRNALLMTEMPPGPIAPALVTPPLKVVWLITIAEVWPLKTVGYGPMPLAPSRGVVAPRRRVTHCGHLPEGNQGARWRA